MLRELQRHFMRAVLDGGPAAGLLPAESVAIYANNARIAFTETLIRTYPAVLRLVGEPYFRQCAREYQAAHPSTSGDLQHLGEQFPAYLARRHGNDQFSYLADVARLEWAYQEALLEAEEVPMDVKRLAAVEPEHYTDLRFRLQDSAFLVSSSFPILKIWKANIANPASDDSIDLRSGPDRVLILRTLGRVRLHLVSHGEFAFLQALLAKRPFGQAVEMASAAEDTFIAAEALERLWALRAIVDFHL